MQASGYDSPPWRLTLTVDIQVEPGAVLVLVWCSVEKNNLALIPALVRLSDVSEVEGGLAIAGLWIDPCYATLVLVGGVRRVVLIPDVHRNILPLSQIRHPATLCARNTVHTIRYKVVGHVRVASTVHFQLQSSYLSYFEPNDTPTRKTVLRI